MMSRFILDLHAAAQRHPVDDTSPSLTILAFATAATDISSVYGFLSTEISVDRAMPSCGAVIA